MSKSAKSVKLEDLPLWKEADALAEHMYALLPQFPTEEVWQTKIKLHNVASDFMLWSSLALANIDVIGQEHDWATFSKYASTLKAVYRFAGRQKFIELDPEIMLRLDKLCQETITSFEHARNQSEQYQKEAIEKDLKPWHEKYEIWKKLDEGRS